MNINDFYRLVLLAICLVTSPSYADSISRKAELDFESDPKRKIKGLTWDKEASETIQHRFPNVRTNEPEFYLNLKGSFQREDYSILVNDEAVPQDQHTNFTKEVIVRGPEETVNVSAIGPKGNLEIEAEKIRVPQFAELRALAIEEHPRKRLSFGVSIGPSLVNYSQSDLITGGKPAFNQFFMTGRFSAVYVLSPSWEASANVFYNLLKLSSNRSDFTIPFLGFNARLGYVLPLDKTNFKVTMNGGWYYVTTRSEVGFRDLSGPQLFPLVRYSLSTSKSVFGYFKYSPITNRFSVLSLSNREIAYGGGYSFPYYGRNWSVGLDISTISVMLDGIGIASNSATLSLGLSF